MRCSHCKTEYTSPFCPNGCNAPTAPYITQRQQDTQGCPFCGSRRIQVVQEKRVKMRWFGRGKKAKRVVFRFCAECERKFK